MKPPPFEFLRATAIAESLDLLHQGLGQETKLIAGGQSLMPLLALRLAAPVTLIDVNALQDLNRVIVRDAEVLVGALVRHARLVEDTALRGKAHVLSTAARHIGHLAIRNRGTIGGSLAHADPAAELPAVLSLLGGSVICESAERGRREVPATDFGIGPFMTQLEDDEMVTWIRIPRWPSSVRYGFAEIVPRQGDYAKAGAVVQVDPDNVNGRVLRAVTFGSSIRRAVFELRLDPATSRLIDHGEHRQLSNDLIDGYSDGDELPATQRILACAAIEKALTNLCRQDDE